MPVGGACRSIVNLTVSFNALFHDRRLNKFKKTPACLVAPRLSEVNEDQILLRISPGIRTLTTIMTKGSRRLQSRNQTILIC